MEFIEPHLIPEAILRLVREATVKINMVTPQCKISNWPAFLKTITEVQDNGIPINFYIKDGDYKSISEVEALNIAPTIVKNLNSILFMNEKEAIITTKNLMLTENGSALEMAFRTTERYEYNEIKDFFNKYISNSENKFVESIPIHRYLKFEVGQSMSL
jgi:hypothetical protein